MKLLHNIGTYPHSNYNTREQVAACREQLSFDGVYRNVWENRDLLLGRKEPTLLFVMWAYIGENNYFDTVKNNLPLERYCTFHQLMDLVINYNCELGSHSWSHENMTRLSDIQIRQELINPPFTHMHIRYFAYPYGNVDERVAQIVKDAGYEDAWSVDQGNGNRFQRKRSYLI